MTCTECKSSWQSEKESQVLITLEYDEEKSVAEQLSQYFEEGFYTRRCCHICHQHKLGSQCTKIVGDEIPKEDLIKVSLMEKQIFVL